MPSPSSPVALPGELGQRYAVRSATTADSDALHALFVAHRTAVLGFCRVSRAEVRSWLEPPPADGRAVDLLVVSRETGVPVQWWNGFHEGGAVRYSCLIVTDPRLPTPDADRLWSEGWARLRTWIDEAGEEPAEGRHAHSACLLGDDHDRRRLAEAGFVHERTFWEMTGPTSGGASPPEVPGLVVDGGAAPEAVHAVLEESFRGHWGFHSLPLTAWLATEQAAAGFDQSLWFLASLEGHPAAAMILCRYDDELYVQEVGTLAPYRRRGIASTLLAQAFAVARQLGYERVMLHVDSENVDGAPRLYGAAGLQVRHATLQHTLRL
ncbi:Acetyltransferase (GNAT) family protein [Friedmanniella luteola]|uniref:Acetyltransferase (GNAT) family protein n=1 Tax=Friedmanniella luteola TaxID=546871 RepID=A0A1H1T1D7_9ACTN|nr:GNAT family N-acetyltransferase [Friedmanniella luteola]SDS53958.1 Acetyltransferase (GNAT) family protein [Friedmanniella luteola]